MRGVESSNHCPPSNSGYSIPFGKKQPLSLLHLRSDTTTAHLSPKVNFYPPPNIPLSPCLPCRCAAVPDKNLSNTRVFPREMTARGLFFYRHFRHIRHKTAPMRHKKSLSGWGRVKVYNAPNRLMGPWEERNVLPLANNKPVI